MPPETNTDDNTPPAQLSAEQMEAMISRSVQAATAPLTNKIAELEGQLAEKAKPIEPSYTRADLDAAVRNGKITEFQANELWDNQQRKQTAELIATTVDSKIVDISRNQAVLNGISEYTALIPDVLVEGTADRKKVADEFNYLVSIGQPKTKATELVALKTIYGPIETLKAARSRARNEETHEESGSGGHGGGHDGSSAPTKLNLTADEKRHYQYCIDRGLYPDWKAVEAELKFANKRVRTRNGAR